MNESVIKTIGVAFAVCLVCSLIVSASAVSLREQQKENKLNDRRVKILEVADIKIEPNQTCLLYTSPSPRDAHESRMPSSA